MKKITVFILASFLLVCAHESTAQMTFGENGTFSNKWYAGELVLNNGETLKGLIKYESAMKSLGGAPAVMRKIFFKKTEKDKKKKYKKEAFRSFTVEKNDGEIAKYATVFVSEKRQRILRVIKEGKVSLYTLKASFFYGNDRTDINQSDWYADYDNFYIKRADEKVASNEFFANVFKNFKKTAKNYFSDCAELVNKIDAGDFENDLIKIVDYYNSNCK